MTADVTRRGTPLRPGDPLTLGPYTLLARLGAGGMGVVFLARSTGGPTGGGSAGGPLAGELVAVKMIHAELAGDDEFRRRFRSEVHRARQVPPFCTAEVLDADPDAPRPYLVVEYVDGPSLADVVAERGPLRAANLHAVAIGVGTALAAIHDAGIIHRDLKPRNVLLAPGSPKVIDFGIARALEATSRHTRTDQLVGTVDYMAPERFSAEAGTPLTPAADVFAWGCVVAYAGTGRTPFHGDSPAATAARILTQRPDLTGLGDGLRGLVELALAADPRDRPTARDLLDLLLGGGSPRMPQLDEALARQPALRSAAAEMRAATGTGGHGPAWPATGTGGHGPAWPAAGPVSDPPFAAPSGPAPAPWPAAPPAGRDRFGSAADAETVVRPVPRAHARPRRKRRVLVGVLAAVGALTLLAGGAYVVADLTGVAGPVGRAPGAAAPATSGPGGPPLVLPDGAPFIVDSLSTGGQWFDSEIGGEAGSNCRITGGVLRAQRVTPGVFTCEGPEKDLTGDHTVAVTARIEKPGTCAGIWFHWTDRSSYVLTACPDFFRVGIEQAEADTYVLRDVPLAVPLVVGEKFRLQLVVEDGVARFGHDDRLVGEATLPQPALDRGRTFLGLLNHPDDETPPYAVSFTDVEIRTLSR